MQCSDAEQGLWRLRRVHPGEYRHRVTAIPAEQVGLPEDGAAFGG
jgi:hypothetical protein